MPHFGGQPSADARQHPPQITDEFPTAPTPPGGTADLNAPRGNGLVTTADDNVARVDRILRERADAQRAADDIRDLREGQRPVTNDRPAPAPTTMPVATNAPLDPPPYDPASDEAAIAQMTGANRPTANPTIHDPRIVADASREASDNNADYGDRDPNSADGLMMTPTQTLLAGPNDSAAPLITRQSAVDPLIALEHNYASRVANDPTNVSAQLEYQLLHFLGNQQVPRPNDMNGLNAEDQALLSAMCDALANFRSVVRTQPNALSSEKARPFLEMAERIASQSDLSVSAPTLCQEVVAFGNYTQLDSQYLLANTPVQAVFYCEVDGFQPVLNESGQYETKLTLELKLFNASHKQQVWRLPTMNVNDVSRRRRRDFFIAKKIELPSNLPADQYMLKAIVKDLQGNRIAEKTLSFSLTSPNNVAAPAR